MIFFSLIFGCQSNRIKNGEKLTDFELIDVNSNSDSYNKPVRFSDFETQTSAWYFGHATWGYCGTQFERLYELQEEIGDAASIIGLNEAGYEAGNENITANVKLPWLQDDETDVWSMWQVSYRDVYIVGPDLTLVDIYNLTENDLREDAAYNEFKSLLLSVE